MAEEFQRNMEEGKVLTVSDANCPFQKENKKKVSRLQTWTCGEKGE